MFIVQFLFGLLIVAIGAFFNIKTEVMLNNFGRIQFFEEHLGSDGGSRLGYKIIGIIAIFIGILLMTGLFNGFMAGLLEPLTRYNTPTR
jgi:hypothetical protein